MAETFTGDGSSPYPRLLSDDPSKDDAFAGKSHERIARVLVKLIREVQPKHRAIGLEGGWGSGKSTVIEIAKKLLQSGEKGAAPYKLFYFDAWAHHGDDFKRAFLEELISWLEQQEILTDSESGDFRDELRANKRETTTKTRPKLSWAGGALAALAPVLPLVYLWLAPVGFNPLFPKQVEFLGFDLPRDILLSMFFALLLLPYAIVFVRMLSRKKGNRSSALGLLVKHEEVEVTTQTIRDVDPTAVEFNAFLDRLIATGSLDKDHFLVVVDNIDRLPANRMEDYWAELRNLIALEGENWKRARIIVPYAPEHVHVGLSAGDEDDSAVPALRDGALQKIFQARIQVAPPMISHWKAFLNEKLDEALGPGLLKEDVRYRLVKLYDYKLSDGGAAATPRDIISFVNRIASIALQWGKDVPIDLAALFVVFQSKIDDPRETLGKGTLLPSSVRNLFENVPWQRYLTALHFNVLPDDADQVLLGSELSRLLGAGDEAGLKALSQNPGFFHVLDEIVEDEALSWARQDPHRFAAAAGALVRINDESPHFDPLFRQLAEAGTQIGETKTLSIEDVGLICTLMPVAGRSRGEELAWRLASWIDNFGTMEAGCDGGSWLQALNEIVGGWKRIDGVDPTRVSARIAERTLPKDAVFALEAAAVAHQCEHVEFSRLRSRTTSAEITKLVVDRIKAKSLAGISGLVSFLAEPGSMLINGDVVMAASERLSGNAPPLGDADAHELFRIVDQLDPSWSNAPPVRLLEDGTCLIWLQTAINNSNWKLASKIFWRLEQKHGDQVPNPGQHAVFGDLGPAFQFCKAIRDTGDVDEAFWVDLSALVEADKDFSRILEHAIARNQQAGWSVSVLRKLIERGYYDRMHVELVLKGFDTLSELLGEELTGKFVGNLGHWEDHFDSELQGDKLNSCSRKLISLSLTEEGGAIQKLGEIVKSRLTSLEMSVWEEGLDQRSSHVELLLIVLRAGPFELPGPAFREPLLDHMINVLEGRDTNEAPADWGRLIDALAADTRKKLLGDLLKRIDRIASPAGIVRFLQLFPVVLEEAPFDRHANAVINALVLPALEAKNSDVLARIVTQRARVRSCLEAAEPTVRGAFQESLQALLDEKPDGASAELIDFATDFGLSPRKLAEDDGDEATGEV